MISIFMPANRLISQCQLIKLSRSFAKGCEILISCKTRIVIEWFFFLIKPDFLHIFLQRMIAGRCWISVMFCSSLRELRKGQLTSRGSFKRYCDTSLQASNGFFTTEYHVVQKLLRQKLECWKREEYGADHKGCEHKRLKQFPLCCWEHDSAPRRTVDKTWSSRLVITF